jgi:hypothetical protein
MKITVACTDGLITVDGVSRKADIAALDPQIRVIQYDTETGSGVVEYKPEVTAPVMVRDTLAEATAYAEADAIAEPEARIAALNALPMQHKAVQMPRPAMSLGEEQFDSYVQPYLEKWQYASGEDLQLVAAPRLFNHSY